MLQMQITLYICTCILKAEYSVLDGINRVDTLPEYISSIGQEAVAITDHGNVSGCYKFYKACKKAGVKPIIGMEAYYTVGDRTAKEKDDLDEPYYHMVLLAQNQQGLKNLFKLSSAAYTEGLYYKPRIDDELLAEYNEGILATSACLGSRSSQLILKGRRNEAERLLDHHAAMFPDRFFIEVQLHEDSEQQMVNQVLMDISTRKRWPLLLTNDCHYTHSRDKLLHERALCMQTNDVMSNPKRFSFGPIDVHVAHHDWMQEKALGQGLPYDAIENTTYIADAIDADSYFQGIRNRYPEYQGLPIGITSWQALENLCKNKLQQKFGGIPPKVYRERLSYELKIIKKMGFYNYLLIVWEFLEGARSEGCIIGPGRGSGAGCLIAYALGITQIDPIKYGLVFERFLNYGRAATPLIFDDEMLKLAEENAHARATVSTCSHNHTIGAGMAGPAAAGLPERLMEKYNAH